MIVNSSNEPSDKGGVLRTLPKVPSTSDFEQGVITRALMAKLPSVAVPPTFEQDVLNRLHSLPKNTSGKSYFWIGGGIAALLMAGTVWYYATASSDTNAHTAPESLPVQVQTDSRSQQQVATPSQLPQPTRNAEQNNGAIMPSRQKSANAVAGKTDTLKAKASGVDATRGGKISDDKLNEE